MDEENSPLTAPLLDDHDQDEGGTLFVQEENESNDMNISTTNKETNVVAEVVSSENKSLLSKEDDVEAEADVASGTDQGSSPGPTVTSTAPTPWERGEKQPPQFRDWPYAILFYVQFITIITLGSIYTNQLVQTVEPDDSAADSSSIDWNMIIIPTLISAAVSLVLILIAFIFLTKLGKSFITFSVWASAIISLLIGMVALSANLIFFGVFSLFSALFGICYAIAVRNRIPFAAANLNAGVSSIKSNGGIILTVLLVGLVMYGWMTLWTFSLVGVMNVQEICSENEECEVQVSHPGFAILWVFFLFWTQQVFKNVIHTTVAGLVGTWYFDPQDANKFCSSAISSSLFRSLTHSFGSICFGSLCVAILQTLDWIVQSLRRQREQEGSQNASMALLLCCLDCILTLLQGIMEFFNKWAFVYVGVYGYDFMTAGKKVMTLFRERGWTVIINDNLISNALGLMCFVIALLNGLSVTFLDHDYENPSYGYFGLGFMTGLILSLTIMSIIDSAVSTIIVCFAEAPEDFERNHRIHSREMREAWNNVYQIQF